MSAVIDDTLLPAWEDGVHASQATFRCVLNALSEPGVMWTLPVEVTPPQPLDSALAALCLALADFETPVWRDVAASASTVASYLRFHCGCPLTTDPRNTSFGLITEPGNVRLAAFAQGTMEYPDRSTTLLIQVPSLDDGPLRVLSGPGIPETRGLRVAGMPADFDDQWHANTASFPLGVDIVFCCGNKIIGLPRTTQIRAIQERSSCM